MFGAILGDIVGSPYEFDRGHKTKGFPLFSEGSVFTDDSVMTIAVADALMRSLNADDDIIRVNLIERLRYWGHKYWQAGYGQRFFQWLLKENPSPITVMAMDLLCAFLRWRGYTMIYLP